MNPSALGQSLPLFLGLEAGKAVAGVPSASAGPGRGSSEMELQKMLIDERMRCENHKTNYQTLKAEHTRLQDEFFRSQAELKRLQSERLSQQEKLQLLLAELRGELLDKTRELEELRLKVMTPQRLELLRAQVQQEMEAPIRERFNKLEEEAEKSWSQYNKLRYDYTLLKSQSDLQREEGARVLEERTMRFQAEISRMEQEREDLVAQYQGQDPSRDGKRVEALLREKAQLHLRLKSLEAEGSELRAQRDDSGQQADSVQRIQLRQLAESQAAIKRLEAERHSLRLQLDRMEGEVRQGHEQSGRLTGQLHKAEREVDSLTCEVEKMKHSHKLEVANVKLESTRTKAAVERERDTLQGHMDSLQTDVEVLTASLERQREVLAEKERELVRRVQAAREEELRKMAALHEEKLELENRLVELEQRRELQDAAAQSQKDEWEGRLHGAQLGVESTRKELQNLRARLQQQSLQLEELERLKAEISHLKQQNQDQGVELEANRRLGDALETLREDLRTTRMQADKNRRDSERQMEERQVQWLEEKHQLQEREAELQQKYSQAKDKLHRAALAQKKRKTQTENKEKKLQDQVQLLEAKTSQLELEASTAHKRPCSSEEHIQLGRKLKEFQRRHGEFRRLLLAVQAPAGLGPAPPLVPGHQGGPSSSVTEEQRELTLLHRRLEELESVQQQQLEELGSPSPPT